ncbi:aminotransferase class III-fold pyridoxal phosphate-dependent enzyme [Caldanaerobius polysaccharolyticus]|uniref:aminotransferase class III-fold pyridoxal phosphate-dependent enzyme n=1 Tax=Caldanaerobius polysaccharolyticus TaxID=44256 RepID=UPI0005590FAF|nr:aminotransferase class III-fold pyridoxal phosphate-dependent enzyme [Caldanaerobius polysaccharolyticus]
MRAYELTKEQIKDYDRKYNLHSWSANGNLDPLVITKAEGIYFWDADGKRYFDMSSQLVNSNIGHGNKKVIEAIKTQAERLAYIAPSYAVDVRSELARRIVEIAPDNMGKVFFTLGGADANENAVKMARMYTGRYKVFSRYRSYHGSTMGAGNITGEPRRFACEPGLVGYVKFFDPYLYRSGIDFSSEEEASRYYVDKLREQIIYEDPSSIAAIVLETVTGSNGVIIPPKGYLEGVRKICDEFGIMMICDEVMVGWGRTGKYFAINNWNVKPDMITFAKGITCGYAPLGGVIVDKKIAEYFDDHILQCGLTYSGHPLGCAAGCATLDVYEEEGILQNVKTVGKVLGEQLEALKEKHPCVGDVRYIGLLSAVELVKDKATKEPLVPYGKDPDKIMPGIVGMLKQKGFATYSHENMIIVAPPLIIKEKELKEALAILDEVLDYVDKAILRVQQT